MDWPWCEIIVTRQLRMMRGDGRVIIGSLIDNKEATVAAFPGTTDQSGEKLLTGFN